MLNEELSKRNRDLAIVYSNSGSMFSDVGASVIIIHKNFLIHLLSLQTAEETFSLIEPLECI